MLNRFLGAQLTQAANVMAELVIKCSSAFFTNILLITKRIVFKTNYRLYFLLKLSVQKDPILMLFRGKALQKYHFLVNLHFLKDKQYMHFSDHFRKRDFGHNQ